MIIQLLEVDSFQSSGEADSDVKRDSNLPWAEEPHKGSRVSQWQRAKLELSKGGAVLWWAGKLEPQ